MLDRSTRVDSPDVESSRFSPRGYDLEDSSLSETAESITGKLKIVCPTLFHSLTSGKELYWMSLVSLACEKVFRPLLSTLAR
jgi:hypothetical protein